MPQLESIGEIVKRLTPLQAGYLSVQIRQLRKLQDQDKPQEVIDCWLSSIGVGAGLIAVGEDLSDRNRDKVLSFIDGFEV